MRRSAKLLAALAVACLAAAGGSAFTNSNTVNASTTGIRLGYSTTTTGGVTVTDVHYDINAAGTTITKVYVQVAGDTSTSTLNVGFNGQNVDQCATGVFNSGSSVTDYQCTTTGLNASITTTAITSIEIVVH